MQPIVRVIAPLRADRTSPSWWASSSRRAHHVGVDRHRHVADEREGRRALGDGVERGCRRRRPRAVRDGRADPPRRRSSATRAASSGRPSITSCASVPIATISPCRWLALMVGSAVKLCANAVRGGEPAALEPEAAQRACWPRRRPRATRSRSWAATAAAAARPARRGSARRPRRWRPTRSSAARRASSPPAGFRRQTAASYQVAIASPMPETRKRSRRRRDDPVSTTTSAGLLRIELDGARDALRRVQHRHRRARRVVRGEGRHDHDRDVETERDRLPRVDALAAADRDHAVDRAGSRARARARSISSERALAPKVRTTDSMSAARSDPREARRRPAPAVRDQPRGPPRTRARDSDRCASTPGPCT